MQWQANGEQVLSTSHQTHLDLVDKGGYAYLTDVTGARFQMGTSCENRLFTKRLFHLHYGIGLQNNSAYTRQFSEM